jgi:hypothetical protein
VTQVPDTVLRQHLIRLLREAQAHITFADVVKDFPVDKAGMRPGGSPHSAWELLEHIRIAQDDIVRFSEGIDYVPLKWPDDYWPVSPAPRNRGEWDKSVAAVEADLERFVRLLEDLKRDLLQPFPWGDGQTLLREALLIADHNAYHVGQLMLIRRMIE